MAAPKRRTGGRVTPKGTRPGTTTVPKVDGDDLTPRATASASSRYTPPSKVSFEEPKRWVPYVMFGLFIIGMLVILINYLGVILPGATNNWYLLVGLFTILAGLIVATQLR
jgi:hypothetical protein